VTPPTARVLLYLVFFASGLSGLIYQVVWVRVFGNVFGNTVYSASLVVAVFMLGLGAGSYAAGAWADRRYAVRPESLLRVYGYVELVIGALGLGVSLLLPHLDQLSALVSSYTVAPNGWHTLSLVSYLARGGIAVVLLMPATLLMGATLTLLIRHLARSDLPTGHWRIAVLYAINTAGAALGCFLTDFALVPSLGLQRTQVVAVCVNLVAGLGALALASIAAAAPMPAPPIRSRSARARRAAPPPEPVESDDDRALRAYVVIALAMAGFAGMGMEMLWFRHFTVLLGGFRAVFSLLLTVVLVGIGAGALIGGLLHRRLARPAAWLMAVQSLFVAASLLGLALADSRPIEAAMAFDPTIQGATGFAGAAAGTRPGLMRAWVESWFNLRPMLLEVGLPALLMGFGFPLGNAIVQRVERSVGRRAGALYLANTAGAVSGSLVAGFLLLPALGIQASATVLAGVAALAVIPLYLAHRPSRGPFIVSALLGATTLVLWMLLPPNHVNMRALPRLAEPERLLTINEGLTEVIAVTEVPGEGRRLLTNGHVMSSTSSSSQRYMRALAHVPLLSMEHPESALVIGFGVGNTTHAVTLHPSIRRVDLADLSTGILGHADFFRDANQGVLADPRVAVYVNDGRQHLQMQPVASYDLITLEPPPIAYAGVAALYSREFYALARSRLTPEGYLSQWLPAYQVPTETTLAMIRAFVDEFPHAVILSGAEAHLILLGVNGPRLEIDPARVSAALARAPAVQADLQRLDLGTVRDIAGMFVGSAETLHAATRSSPPVGDDRPLQEYDVMSLLNLGEAVPASIVDLTQAASWCPRCFVDGSPAPMVGGLDLYLALMDIAYRASPADVARARALSGPGPRVIAGSAYLGSILPESARAHNLLGIALASKGSLDEALVEFRRALQLEPDSAETHWHLGAALAARGAYQEALEHLRRSVDLDPTNDLAREDLVALTRLGERP